MGVDSRDEVAVCAFVPCWIVGLGSGDLLVKKGQQRTLRHFFRSGTGRSLYLQRVAAAETSAAYSNHHRYSHRLFLIRIKSLPLSLSKFRSSW